VNKNLIAIIIGTILLIGGIGYNLYIKTKYKREVNSINTQIDEIQYIKNLKRVWTPKQIKSKITKALNTIPNSNKKVIIKRSRAQISLKNLNDRSLNIALGKLASLPLNFKELTINKSGDKFGLECKCDW